MRHPKASSRQKVRYRTIPLDRIAEVRPLWEALNRYHTRRSTHFSKFFETFTFEERLKKYGKPGITVRIELALVPNTKGKKVSERAVAVCLSSFDQRKEGRLDTIYVEPRYRSCGIGSALMEHALKWFMDNDVAGLSVSVLFGNEVVLPFYSRFGFFPMRYTLLQRSGARPVRRRKRSR